MGGLHLQRAAAFLGATGISAAAFGAHGLSKIAGPEQVRWWAIAAAIHLVTVPAILLCSLFPERLRPLAGYFLMGGVAVFSGSLYSMALGGPRTLGAVTPLGGLLLVVGWALMATVPRRQKT